MAAKKEKNKEAPLIGRVEEISQLAAAVKLGRHVLIEGPVGVGKTYLVQRWLSENGRSHIRVDGDTRYSEQKLTGWFDPPLVLKRGYQSDCFVDGPLVQAMKAGEILFINELNRMPEAVQNILLPAMDEGKISIPKLGDVVAANGFGVIATQNPREFTATHSLSEALLDRFEMISLDYQTREEELEILKLKKNPGSRPEHWEQVVDLIRATRSHPSIKRGASIRAGLAILDFLSQGIDLKQACWLTLPSRMELISAEESWKDIIESLILQRGVIPQKKKIRA